MGLIPPPSSSTLPPELSDRQVVAFILTNPGGNGYVPHGFLVLWNQGADERRAFSTHRTYTHDGGKSWGTEVGRYDLSRSEALLDFADRAGPLFLSRSPL